MIDSNLVVVFVAAKKPVAHWWLKMLLFTGSGWLVFSPPRVCCLFDRG